MNTEREHSGPDALTYISFAEEGVCYGVLILPGALNALEAAQTASAMSLNPGGQVLAMSCTKEDDDVDSDLWEAMKNNQGRLIPEEEARELFDAKNLGELEDEPFSQDSSRQHQP